MASPTNPLASQIMTALMARQQGGSPGGAGDDAGQQYAQQVSELKGADPGGMVRQLKAMKQICAIMLVQNLERLPNVAGKISKLIPMLDQVIKEANQAQNVNAAVRNPINMAAANPPAPQGPGNVVGGGNF